MAVSLDAVPLECDGMTRAISTLLDRDRIPHRCHVGSMTVKGAGSIQVHWWVELLDGAIVDLRARLWLRSSVGVPVPHGVFFLAEGVFYHSLTG